MVVEKKEATRVAREIRVGKRTHRMTVVLESDRMCGRHYVDDVCVAAQEFDRVMALAMMPDKQ